MLQKGQKYGIIIKKYVFVEAMLKGIGKTMANATTMTPEMIDEMTSYRLYELEEKNPVKTRSDFQSDEEYRTYLLDTYVSLRQTEYEHTVRNETMKVFNLASDADKKVSITINGKRSTHYDNQLVWDGYQKYINSAKTPEERARREQQVADCAMGRASTIGGICLSGKPGGATPSEYLHCCAVTASSVVAQVSGKMGYDGKDNLVVPAYRGARPGRRNNIVAAKNIEQADSVQNHIRINPEIRYAPQKPQVRTLSDAVKSGDLNIGDSFALGPKNPNAETTGHAMVIADIIRDENGNITAYTIQGNNPHQLMTLGINDKSGRGGSTVIAGVGTNAFMEGNFVSERQDLSRLSTEELEARVVAQRSQTEQVIADLGTTEKFFVENKFYNTSGARGFAQNYVSQYNQAMSNQGYQGYKVDQELAQNLQAEIMNDIPVEPIIAKDGPDVLMGAKAPKLEELGLDAAATPAPAVEVAPAAPNTDAPATPAPEVETPAPEAVRPAFTPAEKATVAELFTRIDEAGWQQLTGAYLADANKDAPTAEVMRDDAAQAAVATVDGNMPSLVDGLSAESAGHAADVTERPALVTALSDDKVATDGMFDSLLTALTTNDDKNLDDSMKLALNLLTSFLGGVDKSAEDDVPSLTDFMEYLTGDKDKTSTPVLDQEKGRVALQTPSGVNIPLTMSMLREGR